MTTSCPLGQEVVKMVERIPCGAVHITPTHCPYFGLLLRIFVEKFRIRLNSTNSCRFFPLLFLDVKTIFRSVQIGWHFSCIINGGTSKQFTVFSHQNSPVHWNGVCFAFVFHGDILKTYC